MIAPCDLTIDQRKVVRALYRACLKNPSANREHATVDRMRELASGALPLAACGTGVMPGALVDLTLRELAELGVAVEVQPGCWALTADAGEAIDDDLLST
ncbi:MAG: hypothetical protein LC798_11955 [Chloroflexi bacterium]|nr:hypothetical protein [Chloroflexota bacterium]